MKMKKFGTLILAGTVGSGITIALTSLFIKPGETTTKTIVEKEVVQQDGPVRFVNLEDEHPEASVDFRFASEQTVNAVVHVISEYENAYNRDPLFEYFYGPGYGNVKSSGSGVIISDDGYIVTNNHVIENADRVEITLNDKRTYQAEIIGTDPATDLALLKIDEEDLTVTPLGDSDDLGIGEWVLAVGNPFNLTSTVTAGIVSAKARSINLLRRDPDRDIFPIESFIQTDAAVNPGNSGGALVNAKGELIGINTAIASRTGSYAGYSFAVPVNIMKKVVKDLIEFGEVQRAFIGVYMRDIDQELANDLNIDEIRGVYVSRIIEDGAAEEAGMKAGDIILKIGNIEVNNVPEFQEQIGKFRPGDEISVTVKQTWGERVINLKLRNKEGGTELLKKGETNQVYEVLGGSFEMASASDLKSLNIRHGVKIVDLGPGKLRSAGIKEGFIITKVDKRDVHSAKQLVELLEEKEGGILIEGVYPNGMKGYYGFGI